MVALAELEVLQTVIRAVTVDVMHGFIRFKGSSEGASHDDTVLHGVVVTVRHHTQRVIRGNPGKNVSVPVDSVFVLSELIKL